MKERPILFSAPMVRAVLDGRKTQTRRVIKNILGFGKITEFQQTETRGYDWIFRNGRMLWNDITHQRLLNCCPYGLPGDRLWVRETWAIIDDREFGGKKYVEFKADTGDPYPGEWDADEAKGNPDAPKWRPSIYMPRWASRITLEITGIRAERVQDISNEDVIKEGTYFEKSPPQAYKDPFANYEQGFIELWDSINGKTHQWDSNPWVWVVEFRRI